jgi:hypothetical protein
VLIKEKHVPIANLGLFKPKHITKTVGKRLQRQFSMADHVCSWKFYKCRPISGAAKPENTDSRYCVYDSVHRDYVYTQAWIDKLVTELSDATTYELVLGREV